MKKLGVIGGMGPEATSYYYAKVIERTQADTDQEHIDMIILSHASIPDRTKAIQTGQTEAFLKAAQRDAAILEQLGVSYIAIPCNTSHVFLPQIQKVTKVPILNMVEESVSNIQKEYPHMKKVGILGTNGTLQSNLYQRAFKKAGLQTAIPEESAQRAVMSLIYEDMKSGSHGNRWKFDQAYDNLNRQGCQAILLACTELSVFKEYHSIPQNCIDAMDILVNESILRAGAKLRNTYDSSGSFSIAESPASSSRMVSMA